MAYLHQSVLCNDAPLDIHLQILRALVLFDLFALNAARCHFRRACCVTFRSSGRLARTHCSTLPTAASFSI